MAATVSEDCLQSYTDSLLKGDRDYCADVVKQLLDDDVPIKCIYTELFTKSLYKVGELWEKNEISVAREHLATSLTESLFGLVYPVLFSRRTSPCGQKAIVSCVANEYHQLGGKIVADLLELKGVNCIFLGANTPVRDTLEMVNAEKPDILALSVAMKSNYVNFEKIVEEVKKQGLQMNIVAGGRAFGGVSPDSLPDGVKLMTIDALEDYIAA
jgi:MerR family transcriptional regulator, light-induced transcriptional regulator